MHESDGTRWRRRFCSALTRFVHEAVALRSAEQDGPGFMAVSATFAIDSTWAMICVQAIATMYTATRYLSHKAERHLGVLRTPGLAGAQLIRLSQDCLGDPQVFALYSPHGCRTRVNYKAETFGSNLLLLQDLTLPEGPVWGAVLHDVCTSQTCAHELHAGREPVALPFSRGRLPYRTQEEAHVFRS